MRSKNFLLTLAFWLIPVVCFAECYVRYDTDTGKIKQLYYSVDAKVLGIADDADLLYITPAVYKDVSKDAEHYLVKNNSVVAMTADEKTDYDTAKAKAQAAAEAAAAKVPTLEKLLTVLIDKGLIELEDVQDATPIVIK